VTRKPFDARAQARHTFLIMAAILHLDLPRTSCAGIGYPKRDPRFGAQVEVRSS
jgi:hypothetical protein